MNGSIPVRSSFLDTILSAVFKPVGIAAVMSITAFTQLNAQSYGVLRGKATLQDGITPVTSLELELTNANKPQYKYNSSTNAFGDFEFDRVYRGEGKDLPDKLKIYNFPNGFGDRTTLVYFLPDETNYTIDVFGLLGQHVVRIFSGHDIAGEYYIGWNGRDKDGRKVSDGVYIARLATPDGIATSKMMKVDGMPSQSHSGESNNDEVIPEKYRLRADNSEATQPKIRPATFNLDVKDKTTVYNIMLVRNGVPSISNLTLLPALPTIEDTIKTLYDYFDADGDPDSSTIAFYINNQLAQQGHSKLLLPANTVAGDTVKAAVTPHDCLEAGTPDTSDYVVVVPIVTNNIPTISNLSPWPMEPTKDDTIKALYDYFDADGDPDLSRIIFQINGNTVQDGLSRILLPSYTTIGDSIRAIVIPYDGKEYSQPDTSSYVVVINRLPSISNLALSPMNPTPGDTVKVGYVFTDEDGDPDSSLIAIYINNQLAQQGHSKLLLPGQTADGDSLRTIVIPNDGREPGQPDTSNYVVVAVPIRTINLNVQDYFLAWNKLASEVGNMLVSTSIDSGYTDANGDISLQASTDIEDVMFTSPNHLLDKLTLQPGLVDTMLTFYIANNDTSNFGIDEWYFGEYFLKKASSPNHPMNGIYLGMTKKSVPDTAFIGGDIIRPSDSLHVSYGWNSVAHLNAIAKILNKEGEEITTVWVPKADTTYTLYSVDNTVIAIADSAFNHPDSIAQFAYPNMVVVAQDLFPVIGERVGRSTKISSTFAGGGFNGTSYDPDNPTLVIGNNIRLGKFLTPEQISTILSNEFYPSITRQIESDIGYPSIIDTRSGGIGHPTPHDKRMSVWNLLKGHGHEHIYRGQDR